MRKIFFLTAAAWFLTVNSAVGQARPFPQNINYPYGYKSTKVTSADALAVYNTWKTSFLKHDCSNSAWYRVNAEATTQTKSEGQGYGMILTAYYGEKAYFDGMLAFYKAKRTSSSRMLMGWDATCAGFNDQGSATDGDLDVAYSLLVAYRQWGGNYLQECDTILGYLQTSYIVNCGSGVKTLVPGIAGGTAWGGCSLTDISYYTPAHFRLFALVNNRTIWTEVADDAYSILAACANATTGLVPDWQAYNGSCGTCGGRVTYYRYDASRVPWRMAMDYLWNGNTTARDWCAKVTNWANGKGAHNIVDGYNLDGSNNGTYHNSAFVGGFAIGSMCNSQAIVDTFSSEMKTLNDQQYFNLTLKCIYFLILSGNFWKPDPTTDIDYEAPVQPGEAPLVPVFINNKLRIKGLKTALPARIVTLSGEVVASVGGEVSENVPLDISFLKRGLYFVLVSTKDGACRPLKFMR